MQIYSLTLERLERLKKQIADKKAEHDELEALGEKDLWCKDLDDFVEEWENQMRLDDEIRSNIKKMGRRTSRKIGAGKGSRKKGADDEYDPGKKKARGKVVAKKPVVPILSTQQRLFSTEAKKPKPAATDGADSDFDDDDFASLKKTATKATAKPASKPAVTKVPSAVVDISDDDTDFAALAPNRSKRAAAKQPIPVDLSDEDDDDFVVPAAATSKPAAAKKSSPVDLSNEDDDDFVVPAAAASKPAAAKKPSPVDLSDEDDDDTALPTKPQRKAATAKKPLPVDLSDEESDSVLPNKAATGKKPSADESAAEQETTIDDVAPAGGRSKRAAAAKKKTWVFSDDEDESQDDGDDLLGDVGAMVRGIGEPATASNNGRLSLFAMSRSEHGNPVVPKLKTKQSRAFDFDSPDDTNYELLAKSSPQKPPEIDELMSDDEDAAAPAKASSGKPKQSKAPLNVVAGQTKKPRGRLAVAKTKTEDKPAKPVQLSPAAKAYAAKTKGGSKTAGKGKKNVFDFSEEEEEDEDGDVVMDDSPPARPAARSSRPGRAAAKAKSYVVEDDYESMSDADDFDEDEESD